MSFAFSTANVDASQRFAYWHDAMCRHCIPAAGRTSSRDPFDGRLAVSTLGSVGFSQVFASSHHWTRDSRHVRTHPDDDFWLGLMCAGEGHIVQSDRRADVRGGDMVLYDAARPFECTGFASDLYLLRIPRRTLLQRFATAERHTARLIDPRLPGAEPLRTMLLQAAASDSFPHRGAAIDRFASALIDLVAVTLEFQEDVHTDAAAEQSLHARLVSYVRGHLEDPSLSLEALARAHHVSARTVTRAFARHGQTTMGMVWQARLEASHGVLSEGRVDSVTDAAFRFGFADLSHFSRVFRKAYGYAPHSLLRKR